MNISMEEIADGFASVCVCVWFVKGIFSFEDQVN